MKAGMNKKDRNNTTWGRILIISWRAWTLASRVVQTEVIYDWPTSLLRYICKNCAVFTALTPGCSKNNFKKKVHT